MGRSTQAPIDIFGNTKNCFMVLDANSLMQVGLTGTYSTDFIFDYPDAGYTPKGFGVNGNNGKIYFKSF